MLVNIAYFKSPPPCSHHLMVRIQDFHSWHTSSILVESTMRDYNIDWDNAFTLRVANHCIRLSSEY